MKTFLEYADVYDLLNVDKDYRLEAEEISILISKYCTNKDVLSLGCGTGKHDRELTRFGYKIHGLDISDEMVDRARASIEKLPLTYEVADIRTYRSPQKYSIIISLFHVMSYQNSNADLLAAFQTVSSALPENGVFIFDAWYGVGVLRDLPAVRVKRAETETLLVVRIAEPVIHWDKNVVDVNYDILIEDKLSGMRKEVKETHSMRYLFTPEVENYLDSCGLKLVECIDCKTLKKPDNNTWTAYFVVQRK